MNFLLYNALGGGGTSSLHSDPLAKTYGQAQSYRLPAAAEDCVIGHIGSPGHPWASRCGSGIASACVYGGTMPRWLLCISLASLAAGRATSAVERLPPPATSRVARVKSEAAHPSPAVRRSPGGTGGLAVVGGGCARGVGPQSEICTSTGVFLVVQ